MDKNRNLGSDIDRLSSRQGKTNLERPHLKKADPEKRQKPFDEMRRGQVSDHFDSILSSVEKKHILTEDQINRLMGKGTALPISIFNEKLGMLEAASVYIKDELNLSFSEIARLMKKDYRTICRSYNKAKKKLRE